MADAICVALSAKITLSSSFGVVFWVSATERYLQGNINHLDKLIWNKSA
jgi:hypothetical protein